MGLNTKKTVQFHTNSRGIAVLRVNRPEVRNALNWEAQERFAELIATSARDRRIRALIITGTGDRSFVSGGDLKELSHHPERAAGERLNRTMSGALAALTELPVPVLAAINGDALGGGCEIVTACDLRVAAQRARFSFAQVKNGLTTGWGGGLRLINLIGQSQAMELLLTARLFDSVEALQLGLVHRIVPDEENVLHSAMAWAADLIALPQDALAGMKALVYAAEKMSQEEMGVFVAKQFADLWETTDHKEALAAFAQKRPPRFNQGLSSSERE